ncbi:HK97 family phage prohead protease [Anatilimnocola floriformis]|uniref:HK97 family phage prohead protease n=1 Tax=Anatilimnocola floriformis TaxID=2948575 RepID=UPI0020C5A3D7|nr:HK97 family phage prohead protease [Anatilimnocola floriformis]
MESLVFSGPNSITIEDGIVRGLAAVYYDGSADTECQPYPDGTFERIAPGAFDNALKRGGDVIATFDHNQKNLLGRTRSSTLKLTPGARGIEVELKLPDTQLGRDVKCLIERGDLHGFSFTGKPGKTAFAREAGKRVLTIQDFQSIAEIGIVVTPWYSGAKIKRGWHEEEEKRWEDYQDSLRRIELVKNLK